MPRAIYRIGRPALGRDGPRLSTEGAARGRQPRPELQRPQHPPWHLCIRVAQGGAPEAIVVTRERRGGVMRFRSQLVVGHTALLFATLLTGSVAVVALHVANARVETVTRDLSPDMMTVERLRFQSEQLVATSRGYLLTSDGCTWARFDDVAHRVHT